MNLYYSCAQYYHTKNEIALHFQAIFSLDISKMQIQIKHSINEISACRSSFLLNIVDSMCHGLLQPFGKLEENYKMCRHKHEV